MAYKEIFTAKVNEEEGFGKEIILRGERTARHFSVQPDSQGAGMFKDGERYVMTIEPHAEASKEKPARKRKTSAKKASSPSAAAGGKPKKKRKAS